MNPLQKLYDKATGKQPEQQQAPRPISDFNQQYPRQTINVPNYDARTQGTDVNPECERLLNAMRGRRLNSNGTQYITFKGATVMISEGGAEWLIGIHRSKLSLANATTNLQNNRILELCKTYANNLLEIVLAKEEEWEIDASFFDFIIDELADSYELFLRKSLEDKQRKFMWGSSHKQPEEQQMQNYPQFTA